MASCPEVPLSLIVVHLCCLGGCASRESGLVRYPPPPPPPLLLSSHHLSQNYIKNNKPTEKIKSHLQHLLFLIIKKIDRYFMVIDFSIILSAMTWIFFFFYLTLNRLKEVLLLLNKILSEFKILKTR